jgi:CBS-domain-containing membrane protein
MKGHDLKVRTRRTVDTGGEVTTHRTVHCPRREGAATLAECVLCVRCEGLHRDADGTSVICAYEDGARPGPDAPNRRRIPSPADTTPLSAVMSTSVLCVSPNLDLESFASLLVDQGVTGAPVVDADGRAIGVVSKSDLIQSQHDDPAPMSESEMDDELAALGPGYHLEPTRQGTVGELMMPLAFTLPESASLSQAAALMAFEGIHRVPVTTTDGTVVGIVSSMDVVRWLAEQAGYVVPRSGRR